MEYPKYLILKNNIVKICLNFVEIEFAYVDLFHDFGFLEIF